ncbi:MAG TPA: MFS transporter [Pyrinomonadaceae bacterium]|jgi:ACS family hexuronate transporter-like MFS transporter
MNDAGEIANAPALPKTTHSSTISPAAAAVSAETLGERVGRYRWVICGLLFFATTVNYVDRQVLGLLAKDLKSEIGWTEIDYGNIVAAFNAAYAFGLLLAGRLMDRIGTRVGYALAIVWWSLAAMAHALARTPLGFGVARAALGFGEAGNFPAAIKTVAEWFPKKERAFATGLFNAGSNVGAIVAPLCVPWIAGHLGWRWAFILTGVFGFLWLLFWLPTYRHPEKHAKVSAAELAHIQSDPPDPPAEKIPWVRLIPHRQTSAFAIGKYLTDPVWWFYLYWIPTFFREHHKLDLTGSAGPLIVIYLIADIGSIGGGWLSSTFIKRGWTINRARKTAMLICALAVTPIIFASNVKNLWVAALLIGLAAAAHQGWSCNLFTTTSDMFPRRAVGSVVGIGGMAGALGGATMAVATGYILESTGQNYSIVFTIAGTTYLLALAVIHLLSPQLAPVEDVERLPGRRFSAGLFIGFGFAGLVFGSFVGWCVSLAARVSGGVQFEYMMIAGGIGIVIGAIGGLLLRRND